MSFCMKSCRGADASFTIVKTALNRSVMAAAALKPAEVRLRAVTARAACDRPISVVVMTVLLFQAGVLEGKLRAVVDHRTRALHCESIPDHQDCNRHRHGPCRPVRGELLTNHDRQ